MNHNVEHLNNRLQLMEAMNKIAFFCGLFLLVLILCPVVTAYDSSAEEY